VWKLAFFYQIIKFWLSLESNNRLFLILANNTVYYIYQIIESTIIIRFFYLQIYRFLKNGHVLPFQRKQLSMNKIKRTQALQIYKYKYFLFYLFSGSCSDTNSSNTVSNYWILIFVISWLLVKINPR
jgi:hypothetical protein